MALSEEVKVTIKAALMPVIGSAVTMLTVAAATAVVQKLTAINYKKSNLTGDTEMKPTNKDVSINKSETSASSVDGSLSAENLSANEGTVTGAETNAKAATGDATAVEGGAQAVRTKAGASDIEVKALKIT